MSRHPRTLIVVALCAVAAGYGLWWWQAARSFESALAGWARAERAQGGAVTPDHLSVSGFPLTLRVTVPQVSVQLAKGPSWQGSNVTAQARPWQPTHIQITLSGAQDLALPADSGRPPLHLAAAGGHGTIDFALGGGLDRATLTLQQALLEQPGQPAGRLAAEEVGVLLDPIDNRPADASPVNNGRQALHGTLAARAVSLPALLQTPLGRVVDHIDLALGVAGPLPADLAAPELAAWRRAGGTVTIDRMNLVWGPLQLTANGTLGLDADLRPAGRLAAEMQGLIATIEAAQKAGLMRPNDAALAKAAAGLLASRRTPDGDPVVDAPLALGDGWLSLGPVRLAALPPLAH